MAKRLLTAIGEDIRDGLTWLVVTVVVGAALLLVAGAIMYGVGALDSESGTGSGITPPDAKQVP